VTNTARIIRVFISSPDDVVEERNIVREQIYAWNSTFSIENEIVLLPVGWDKELRMGYGLAPQEKVNKELLPHCELLIAIFGEKVGSRTKNYSSGTIEEIALHTEHGKEALIFFKELDTNGIDNNEEYEKLQTYKDSIKDKCIYNEFSSIEDFKNKFRDQLNLHMQEYNKADWKASVEESRSKVDNDDQILKYNIDQWGMKLELESMKDWITVFTGSVFRLSNEKYESLKSLMLWMFDRTWGSGHEEFENAFLKFRAILSDMLIVISKACHLNIGGYHELEKTYNMHSYESPTHDYLYKTYEFNKYLIMDYAAELCRATNFILDIYRKKVDPLYLIEFGKMYMTSGRNMKLQYSYYITEYHDTDAIPYNGYDDFLVSRTERDVRFGAGENIKDPVFEEWLKRG